MHLSGLVMVKKVGNYNNMITIMAFVLILISWEFGAQTVDGAPEAIARPTRPKAFTNVDDLRKYLDLVRDYYSLSGKARYTTI